KDYVEFDGRCQDFFREIDQEMADHHWTFAELEENEEDLAKLTSWLRKIQSRDFFPGPHSAQAARQLVRCRQMLDTFMHAVYTAIGLETKAEQGVDEAEYPGETLAE
ncbi:MAG TPA: Chromate resistance protein ChrB, partial [Ktedonobacteraceae bacterium]|nr:Chromate resistance protein ChrB [Ktedonobacteraceae bacterium]